MDCWPFSPFAYLQGSGDMDGLHSWPRRLHRLQTRQAHSRPLPLPGTSTASAQLPVPPRLPRPGSWPSGGGGVGRWGDPWGLSRSAHLRRTTAHSRSPWSAQPPPIPPTAGVPAPAAASSSAPRSLDSFFSAERHLGLQQRGAWFDRGLARWDRWHTLPAVTTTAHRQLPAGA